MADQARKSQAKVVREAFFVQVPAPDDTVAFHNVTPQVGKPMPFAKPRATCAMSVTDVSDEADARVRHGVVAFSLLHLTKKTAANLAEKPIQMPRGPLAMLARKAAALGQLDPTAVVAEAVVPTGERDDEGNVKTTTYARRLEMSRDGAGIVTLEADELDVFELPPRALRLTLYLASPVVPRTLAVGFIGHIGRPGDQSTLVVAASKVLFSMSQLTEFRVLSGIETVAVPAAPSARIAKPVVRRPEDQAVASVRVRFFSTEGQPVAEGEVVVEVDLENANPASNRLLYHYHPSDELAPHFDAYRVVLDQAVNGLVTAHLGADDVANITYDIVLGGVESGTVERLQEALATVAAGLDFTPTQWRFRQG